MESVKLFFKNLGVWLCELAVWVRQVIAVLWKDRIGRRAILGTGAAVVLLLAVLIYRPTRHLRVTLEAGDALPDPIELTEQMGAVYLNAEEYDPAVPGVYKLTIKADNGKYRLRVKLKDTVAPTATVHARNWGLGTPMPDPMDFLENVTDATAVTVVYVNENKYTAMSTYPVKIRLTDLGGNETEYETTVTLVSDTTPPAVTAYEISGYIGYGMVYSGGVRATDDCVGKISITWDASKVDTDTVGKYPVYYTVIDASGNITKAETTIYIYKEEVTPEMLYVKIDAILDELVTPEMSVEARVRAVYDFVYDHISYAGTSDKSSWMQEAYHVLESGTGDCYSYFALSKAFFERLGLPNLDIQRTTGLTEDRHWWNFVNIGTGAESRWYYFDATHLNTTGTGGAHSGCLLTEKQIMAYNKVRAHFYTFDHTGYPEAATEIITETRELEKYY